MTGRWWRPAPIAAPMPAAQSGSDAGVTLIETVTVMTIMSIAGAIVTAGVVSLMRSDRSTVALVDAQRQAGRTFLRLDSELRYAADLRTQLLSGGQSAYPSLLYLSTAGGARCYALSIVGDRLVRQEWTAGSSRGPATPLADGVSPVNGVAPFVIAGGTTATANADAASSTVAPKTVTITLTAAASGSAGARGRELSAVFQAPNTVRGPDGVSLDQCVQ